MSIRSSRSPWMAVTPGPHAEVKIGDVLRVKREFLYRGGEAGQVIRIYPDGVSLLFDDDGESIEGFWRWDELDLPPRVDA